MQMRKQRQRTGEQRSMRIVRRTCLNGKDVIKKTTGGIKYKKNKTIYFFLFLPKTVFEHVYISTHRDRKHCHTDEPGSCRFSEVS